MKRNKPRRWASMDDPAVEATTLDAIVKFSDELDGQQPVSIDQFLMNYPTLSHEIRPYLETIVRVRNGLVHLKLSEAESISLLSKVQNRVADLRSTGAVLDRR